MNKERLIRALSAQIGAELHGLLAYGKIDEDTFLSLSAVINTRIEKVINALEEKNGKSK